MGQVKFDVLDNLTSITRTLLLTLCGFTCCWGFVNNTILLVFAAKIGFPIAVAACAMAYNKKQIANVIWYTCWLVIIGTLYFLFSPVVIDPFLTKNFVPATTDFLLAVGLGFALDYFWHHPIRINLIIMSAGLTSLLPACIMAGYYISKLELAPALDSILLYLQYVVGMYIGTVADKKLLKKDV